LVAAILYIIQNHLDDLVKPGKKIIKDLVMSDIEDDFIYVKAGPEKDSLKIILENYLTEKLENADEISDKDFNWLGVYLNKMAEDSVIDEYELEKFKELIKENKAK